MPDTQEVCPDGSQALIDTKKEPVATTPWTSNPASILSTAAPVADALRDLQQSRELQHQHWLQQLDRLKDLGLDLALLPVGAGNSFKGPMDPRCIVNSDGTLKGLEDWQNHPGFSVEELQSTKGIRSVGARTGIFTGPLLGFDWDGETSVDLSCDLGIPPWMLNSWHVHRNNDPWRLKGLTSPTPEQIAMLPVNADGSVEFTLKLHTKAKQGDSKGEALEVFFHSGRQVIVLGDHPSSGGFYYWPQNLGPEALSPPPDDWWQVVVGMAQAQQQRTKSTAPRSNSRNKSGTKRLDPCPICGRHSGKGGSALWCDQTTEGLIFCMGGSTFNAEHRHGSLIAGQSVVNGYKLTKKTITPQGDDCFVFAPAKEAARV